MDIATKTSSLVGPAEDIVDSAVDDIVSLRRKQRTKISKKLERIIELRINAVLNAKVRLNVTGVVTSQDDNVSENDASEELSDNSDVSICNDPNKDEALFCSDMIGGVEGSSSTVRNVVSKVQKMHKRSHSELLALFKDYVLPTSAMNK